MHDETQNVNGSLNNPIGAQCPKRVHVGNSTLTNAVTSAVISFNDEAKWLLSVFDRFGIKPGYYTMEGCTRADLGRIKQSDRKSTERVKASWKTLRAIRKDFNDKHELDEGEKYASRSFLSVTCLIFVLSNIWKFSTFIFLIW